MAASSREALGTLAPWPDKLARPYYRCCQQAAEKALKGFLTWHDRPFRKTHSLEEPGEQCLTVVPALRPIIDQAVPLTEYAWKFRYPGEMEEPSRTEAEDALATAREVYLAVISRLPAELQ